MNAYEIYFLIAATYLHDIGMANIPELLKDVKINKKDSQEVQDYIRDHHHERSEKYILDHAKDFFIKNKWEAEIIGAIAKGHRKVNLYDTKQYDPGKTYGTNTINIPFLASLLRVADELDLTFERIPMTIYEHITPTNKISKREWERHVNTTGIDLDKEDPLTIRCDAVCENKSIHDSLKKMETKINYELSELIHHLHHYAEQGYKIPRKFKIVIDSRGYDVHDVKFSIDEKRIMELLLGEQLYKRKEECLRELLKNAVDSCRLKKAIFGKKSYSPKISFELSPKKDILTVTDNGVGMTKDVLDNHFTRIGSSFYKSEEFLDKKLNFQPVSELGIGILSCFMIADRIEIETKSEKSEPLSMRIDGIADYFLLDKSKMKTSGMKLKLFLKKETKYFLKLTEEIQQFARHVEFPITVKEGKKKTIIQDRGFKPRWKEFSKVWNSGIATSFDIKIDEPHVEGVISFLGAKDEKLGWAPLSNEMLGKYNEGCNTEKRFSTSIEGILINNDYLIEWTHDKYLYVDLNIKGNVIDLDMSRNSIIKNEKYENFIEIIENAFFNGLEKLFKKVKPKLEKEGIEFRNFFLTIYGDVFHYGVKNADLSKQVVNYFKKNHEYACLTKKGLEYLTGDEIQKRKKEISFLKGLISTTDEHLEFLWRNIPKLQEDKIIIASAKGVHGTVNWYVIKEMAGKNIFDYIKLKAVPKTNGVFGELGQVVKFVNIPNKKFFFKYEFPYEYDPKTQKPIKSKIPVFSGSLINYDHPFTQLILKHRSVIKGERKMAFNYFNSNFSYFYSLKFKKLLKEQKIILNWFVEDRIIKEDQIKNYLFKESDFSFYLE